jgi:hypothetical protein
MLRIIEVPSERLVLRRQLEGAIEDANNDNARHYPNRAGDRPGHQHHHSQHHQWQHPRRKPALHGTSPPARRVDPDAARHMMRLLRGKRKGTSAIHIGEARL